MTAAQEETTVALGRDWTVREPGVVDGMPEDVYHADPVPDGSLSCSGAKKLLPPSCPALFKHHRDHGQEHKAVFDFGRAAHKEVLGTGGPVTVLPFADYRTKAAQQARDEAYEAGVTPLLAEEHDRVVAMAAALRDNWDASRLFDPANGKPEQSLFRRDFKTGTMLRSRLDWLPQPTPNGRMVVADYKTASTAELDGVATAMARYGYHQQGAWYVDMVSALGLAEHVEFVLVFQEKTAPYLVTVVRPDDEALRIGRLKNRDAIDTYAQCVRTGVWPGYTDGIELIGLPVWATYGYDLGVV